MGTNLILAFASIVVLIWIESTQAGTSHEEACEILCGKFASGGMDEEDFSGSGEPSGISLFKPKPCPPGYRRDHFGKCRKIFGPGGYSRGRVGGDTDFNGGPSARVARSGQPCPPGYRRDHFGKCRKIMRPGGYSGGRVWGGMD